MKRSIILVVLLLLFIVGFDNDVDVTAGSFTQSMTVSVSSRDNYRQRTQGGTVPLSVKLDATSESRGNKYVQYAAINYSDEQAVSDWVRVYESGVKKNANFADSWGFSCCYAGDEIFVRWKNSTNFYWNTYTVYGTVWYY